MRVNIFMGNTPKSKRNIKIALQTMAKTGDLHLAIKRTGIKMRKMQALRAKLVIAMHQATIAHGEKASVHKIINRLQGSYTGAPDLSLEHIN